MTTLAPTPSLFLNVLDGTIDGLTRSLAESAGHERAGQVPTPPNGSAIIKSEIAKLQALRAELIQETVRAFERVEPADVRAAALSFGRTHWRKWCGVAQYALGTQEEHGLSATNILEDARKNWSAVAALTETVLPRLPGEARKDFRSTAQLASVLLLMMQRQPELKLYNERETKKLLAPDTKLPDGELELLMVIHAVFVLGAHGTAPDVLLLALARCAWDLMCSLLRATPFVGLIQSSRAAAAKLEIVIAKRRRSVAEPNALDDGRVHRLLLRYLSGGWSWAIYGRDESGRERCLSQHHGFGDSRKNVAKQAAVAAARRFAATAETT